VVAVAVSVLGSLSLFNPSPRIFADNGDSNNNESADYDTQAGEQEWENGAVEKECEVERIQEKVANDWE